MSNDQLDQFLKTQSDSAPVKPSSEYSQILNKIEKQKPAWKSYLILWPAMAVAFIFIGFVSLNSLKQASVTSKVSPAELASLESYIETEFYSISVEDSTEEYY